MKNLLIAPSILSADFGKLNQEIASIERFADMVHVDVMDGHFVPNITFGPDQVACMKSKLPMDVHLMIENPEKYVEEFAGAVEKAHGRRDDCFITIHIEASTDTKTLLQKIRMLGCKAAIALNPETPLSTVQEALDHVDMILLMTVHPGFGGQKFIESVLPKIREIRNQRPELPIQVDGGINKETARQAREAGATVLVAGSYIFGAKDRDKAIASLRE